MTIDFQNILAAFGPAALAEGAKPAAGALPPPSPPTPGFAAAPQATPAFEFTTAPWPVTDEAADGLDEQDAEREAAREFAGEMERAARLRARKRRLELEAEIRAVDPWHAEAARANSARQNARRLARLAAKKAGVTDHAEIERLANEAAAKVVKPAPTVPHGSRWTGESGLDIGIPVDEDLRRDVARKRQRGTSRAIDAVFVDEGPELAETIIGLARGAETDHVKFRAASYVVDRAHAAGRALDLGDLAAEIARMPASRAVDAVALAVLEGRLTTADGELAMKLCEARVAALQIDDLLGRIDQLQARIADLAAKSAAPPRE
ncbi:MAG: hypothetical protein OEL76_10710 [Siculibacillus sp.]|nr:hypothetical protein [Siculibacillus sp.]